MVLKLGGLRVSAVGFVEGVMDGGSTAGGSFIHRVDQIGFNFALEHEFHLGVLK